MFQLKKEIRPYVKYFVIEEKVANEILKNLKVCILKR